MMRTAALVLTAAASVDAFGMTSILTQRKCTDQTVAPADKWGSCADYQKKHWCTASKKHGHKGGKWGKSWGNISKEILASCCACGGGVKHVMGKPMVPANIILHKQCTGQNFTKLQDATKNCTANKAGCSGVFVSFCGLWDKHTGKPPLKGSGSGSGARAHWPKPYYVLCDGDNTTYTDVTVGCIRKNQEKNAHSCEDDTDGLRAHFLQLAIKARADQATMDTIKTVKCDASVADEYCPSYAHHKKDVAAMVKAKKTKKEIAAFKMHRQISMRYCRKSCGQCHNHTKANHTKGHRGSGSGMRKGSGSGRGSGSGKANVVPLSKDPKYTVVALKQCSSGHRSKRRVSARMAGMLCAKQPNCTGVLDTKCDGKGAMFLCNGGSSVLAASGAQKSCVYEKNAGGATQQ